MKLITNEKKIMPLFVVHSFFFPSVYVMNLSIRPQIIPNALLIPGLYNHRIWSAKGVKTP